MPKIILNNGSEFFVDSQVLNDNILPVGEGEMIQVGDKSFRKSEISQILEYAVERSYHYASPWRRLFSFIIDWLMVLFLSYFLFLFGFLYYTLTFLGVTNELDISVDILSGLILLLYFMVSFFLFKNTLGGKITHINILNTNGEYPSRLKLIVRSIWLLLFWFASITILFDKKNRALHDMVFGTIVTKDRIL
jgi:uncharacterized RDD family membrane protein YckC